MRTIIKYSMICIAFLCVISCDGVKNSMVDNSKEDEVKGKQISISCAPELQKILSAWVKDFNQSHPQLQVSIQDSSSDFLLLSENQVLELNDEDSWRIPVMREGIIPVISDKNPYQDILRQQGINKEKLKMVFTGKQIKWGEILGTDAMERVTVFLPDRRSVCNKKWADFLEVDVELLVGKRFQNKETLHDSIMQNPFIIAILGACCAYNPETGEREKGTTALPIDLNNNGRIDRNEEISDELCDLERALYLGLHPSKLCSCIFLQAAQKPVNAEQIIFIKWILTEGQKHVADHGFSVIRNSMAVKAIQDLEDQVK